MTEPRTYKISELAKEFQVTTRTIRFYEAEGLLKPQRQGQNRIYSEKDRVNLILILRGKRIGFSLAESKQIINLYTSGSDNKEQTQLLLWKIKDKRVSLNQQLDDIKEMQKELDGAEQKLRNTVSLSN